MDVLVANTGALCGIILLLCVFSQRAWLLVASLVLYPARQVLEHTSPLLEIALASSSMLKYSHVLCRVLLPEALILDARDEIL